MSDFTEELRENPSTYFVQDRSNRQEMERLDMQDKIVTIEMGGVLSEFADPSCLRQVLDVGCGTGGWLMEMARTYPTIERLVGADISGKILAYARTKAESLGLGTRVQFQTMDALRVLEFPTSTFDLVNQRLAASWLRTWDWKKILLEYHRVTRPGGIVRITEANIVESNSPALTKLWSIFLETFFRSGHYFTLSHDGLTSELARLMTQHGFEDVQTRLSPWPSCYRAGTEMGQCLYEDMAHFFRLLLPFFNKWTCVPSDYEEIYQQALKDMQQPDCVVTGSLLTAWGVRSRDGRTLLMRGLK
jgi:ubiquinone/menaquinone biosynthesis C-methylase UbiE